MSQEVGFDVTADVDGAINRLRQLSTEAEGAFNRITEAARRMEEASSRASGGLGGGMSGASSRGPGGAPADRAREREHWDRLYGRGAQRDLRESIANMRRYQEALRAAGQEGRRFSEIDWSGGLGEHRAGMARMEDAWRAHLRDPRNARLRSTLDTYGMGGLSAPDVLGRLGGIYGGRAGEIGDRILADLQQRMAGGGLGGGLPAADAAGGGGGGLLTLGRRFLGPLAAMYGAGRIMGDVVGAVQGAAQWSQQVDPLFRATRGSRDGDFRAFQFNLAASRDGLALSAAEMTGLAALYSGATQDRGAMSVLAGTRVGAGLALGAGSFDPTTGVATMAAADFWSGGKQGKAELAAMIADGLERSHSVQQGGQVLQQFSSWIAQTGAAGGTVDMGAWWDTMTRLSGTGSPLAQGAAGAGLIDQVAAGLRAGVNDEQQLIFTARALKAAGINTDVFGAQALLEQGPFTPAGDTTLIEARIAQFRRDMGADMETKNPSEFYARAATMLGGGLNMQQAKAVFQAFAAPPDGRPGLGEWQRQFAAKGGLVAPDAYADLARVWAGKDEELDALFAEMAPGLDGKARARLSDYFPKNGISGFSFDQQRAALMEALAQGRIKTPGGDIAQAEADKATTKMANFGTQLDETTILFKKLNETLYKMVTPDFWLKREDAPTLPGGFEDASYGIPDAAPAMGAMLIKAAMWGGGAGGAAGGVMPAMWGGMGGGDWMGAPGEPWRGGAESPVSLPHGGAVKKGRVSARDIYAYLRGKGVSRTHALGMLANIQEESGFKPSAVGPANEYGLFQHHKERKHALFARYGRSPTWQEQVDYALTEGDTKRYLGRKFGSSEDAAEWFLRKWERPADPETNAPIRRGHARRFEKNIPEMPPGAPPVALGDRTLTATPARGEIEVAVRLKDKDTGRMLDTDPPRAVVRLGPIGISPHAVG